MRFNIYIFVVILLFAGCSNKQTNMNDTKQNNNIQKLDENKTQKTQSKQDEFADEFSDEFDDDNSNENKENNCMWLDGYNEVATSFNDGFYINVLTPVSKGYETITTKQIRVSIDNFFYNLLYTKRVINNLLQLKFRKSLEETGTFAINTTFGLLGFFKPAQTMFDMKTHNEDFGQTLGFYGVGTGCHIVVPLLGPSNFRDLLGDFVDFEIDPINPKYDIVKNYEQYVAIRLFKIINESPVKMKQYRQLKKDALYLYPFLKNVYEQFRYNEVQK